MAKLKRMLEENIKFITSVIVLFSLLGGVAVDIIPMPARAADLDKLANSVQQMHDTYNRDTDDHDIKHLQDQIANLELQFMVAGKPLSPSAEFYIKQKKQEIENIR